MVGATGVRVARSIEPMEVPARFPKYPELATALGLDPNGA